MGSGFLRIRVREVKRLLLKLDATSGTGPDLLPARILKTLGVELALPVTLLARRILDDGRWPLCWRRHWIHPLFKRKSKADARNYRGVHLTPQLSKVVERTIGGVFIPWVEANGVFGPHQYAYSKRKGYKDVLIVNVCSWISLLERGLLVGVYCSDVAGAFDRVSCDRLCAKLQASGLHPKVVSFLASWLEDRVSSVVVGGVCSEEVPLTNSVFQGTVLGPPLWNIHYADARFSVNRRGYIETVFADDFNAWKAFIRSTNDDQNHDPDHDKHAHIWADLRTTQEALHRWGVANQVVFDPSKESFHVIHRRDGQGEEFKILGVVFDSALRMHVAARHIATEAGWRLQTLLRARSHFSTPEIVHLYKAQVLSFIESSTPGIYHASVSVLGAIDRVQDRFLRNVGLSDRDALFDYRLAPLTSRRDIAMLGVLHKVVLGIAPKQISDLFPILGVVDEPFLRQRVRHFRPLHDKQISTQADFMSTDLMQRSLFGLVRCYNQLPQSVVESKSVRAFQGLLQFGLKSMASSNRDSWQTLFSREWRLMPRSQFHDVFS